MFDEIPLATEQRRVRDAYGFSFALVLLATLGLIAAGSPMVSPMALLAVVMQFGALLITLRVSGFHHRWGRGVALGVALVVLASVIGGPLIFESGRFVALGGWIVLLAITVFAIARRLVTYTEVTIPLLMGLLVIYMLIGLMFAGGYQLADLLSPPGMKPEGQGISGAIYFSFITLATLGYGDVTPANNVVRALAVAEALVGQLYLVSVVSLAVSRLRYRRPAETVEQPDQE